MIKKYLIPNKDNDYKPHVFREASVALILAIVLVVFISSVALPEVIKRIGLTAAVISSVITDSTNMDRASAADLPPLTINPLLQLAAQDKANDMAAKGYFSHTGPDGSTPWDWMSLAGYPYLYAGENLAVDFTDSQAVENAWMNSPDHRANILNSHFTEIGIATAQGMLGGRETTFVVEMFGSPRPNAVAAAIASTTPVTATTAVAVAPTPKPKPVAVAAVPADQLETLASSSNFIAVRVKGESISPSSSVPVVTAAATPVHYSDWYERLIVNPSQTLETIYLILAAFIILALILFIFIEWRVQHLKNIFYAVLLLVIIFSLLYFHQMLFSSQIAVI